MPFLFLLFFILILISPQASAEYNGNLFVWAFSSSLKGLIDQQ